MDRYIGIIEHEHHVSARHPRMSMPERAAQFAPFAALTGYDDVISETGRRTDAREEMDEVTARQLDAMLADIMEHLPEKPEVTLTVFEKDRRKAGGRYISVKGRVRNVSLPERTLTLVGGRTVRLDDVTHIAVGE